MHENWNYKIKTNIEALSFSLRKKTYENVCNNEKNRLNLLCSRVFAPIQILDCFFFICFSAISSCPYLSFPAFHLSICHRSRHTWILSNPVPLLFHCRSCGLLRSYFRRETHVRGYSPTESYNCNKGYGKSLL